MIKEKVNETAYITPRGVAKIEAELSYLKNTKRPDIIERLQDSLAGGDWIDNTEYLSVQDELAFVDGRIQELAYILRHAELIQPGEIDGIIRLGSTVVVQEEGAELETYTVVGPPEADPSNGLISNRSPLGRALVNHTIGDDVVVNAPNGVMRFRIIAVS
ncbi:MAG: transcription elongation factor GreA [Chloroflexi bacterium]|nr:MAG: transcription elongation factor GreA [Chloroflexota bacterium]